MKCPYCGAEAHLKESSFVHTNTSKSQKWDKVWVCDNYPKCDAYVGCHHGTEIPKGRLANQKLRNLKKEAHKAFDPIWKSGLMNRRNAYAWLSDMLNIPIEDCHIGLFDIKRCEQTISICSRQDNDVIKSYRDKYGSPKSKK